MVFGQVVMNKWITSPRNMAVLMWSKARYTCDSSKSNSTSNVIGLVIWFLAFSLGMRKLYIFIYEIQLVYVDVGECSMSTTKSLFSLQTENIFYHYFYATLWGYLKMQGNVVVGVIVIFILNLGLVRVITSIRDPFLAKRRGKFYPLMAVWWPAWKELVDSRRHNWEKWSHHKMWHHSLAPAGHGE